MTDIAGIVERYRRTIASNARRTADITARAEEAEAEVTALSIENTRLRGALHEIDIEAQNTIPPDGKDAAFAALFRIAQIINPFRVSGDHGE